PSLAGLWVSGVITAEHVDAVAANTSGLTGEQVAAVVAALDGHWGYLSPQRVAWFADRARKVIDPPPDDPDERERRDYEARFVSLSFLGGVAHLTGALPRLEGEALLAALTGLAERLRAEGDGLTTGQRRADALVEMMVMANRNTPTPAPASDPAPDPAHAPDGVPSATGSNGCSDGSSGAVPDRPAGGWAAGWVGVRGCCRSGVGSRPG
ncbi:MAG: DUF222 domain-containing protein, partial [Candidatus Nanopelagicales bacterium]